ncbi:MAG TPA: radical SAM protein, partial [Caulobacteraceae bacterium]
RPDRARRVMSLVRQMRGGRDYDPEWGKRMRGEGPVAELIATRFRLAVRKFGLDRPFPPMELGLFQRPSADPNQMELFG